MIICSTGPLTGCGAQPWMCRGPKWLSSELSEGARAAAGKYAPDDFFLRLEANVCKVLVAENKAAALGGHERELVESL